MACPTAIIEPHHMHAVHSSQTPSRQSLLASIGEKQLAIEIADSIDHWVSPMKPERMICGPKPSHVPVKVVA